MANEEIDTLPEKEKMRRDKISQSLVGNSRRLGIKSSDETKLKQSISLKGKSAWNKGKKLSDLTRLKMSLSRKGRQTPWMKKTPSEETKNKLSETSKKSWNTPDIRKKYHDSLKKTKWLKVRTDKGQLELLDKWNRLGFNFNPNYQVKTDLDLFYVDGYDVKNNIVLEYDSKYHKNSSQKRKDLIRQQRIIDILHPKKFWRYDSVDKQIRNILGD
jgi:hypothetical protein